MTRAGPRSPVRHGVGYGLPVLVAAAATVTWFSPGRFFATGDVPPYQRTGAAAELTPLWSHQVTGAGSAFYAVLAAPDVALLAATGALGGGAPLAQHVLYLLAAGYAAFGAAYLAGAWVRHPAARAAAGLLGAFNVFLLVSYPNPLPAVAIGLTGVLAGLVLRAARGRRVRPLLLAVASLPLCYLAQNPPLLVVVAVGVLAAAVAGVLLAGRTAVGPVARLLARGCAWALPLHLWWLVPYALTLRGDGGATVAAQTDVLAWSWSHARASLPNVVSLNGHWGWTDPDLYPYAPAMDAGIGSLLRWLLPGLALAAPLCAPPARRRAAWLLAAALVPVVLLATGTHPPFGGVNLWLYGHVPGAWLFRDPMSKLGVPLVLGYAALAGLTVQRVAELAARIPTRRVGALLRTATVAVVVAAAAYPAPLWTGAVAPTRSGLLPGARVAVPRDWYRVAALLNADPAEGKVLILPLDPYYQVDTAWGYYGVDDVPAELIGRPVLRELPGGYFSASAGVRALLEGVQRNLLDGDAAAAAAQLRALGASHLVVRSDLRGNAYVAAPADPGRIAATARRLPGVTVLADTPVGALFGLAGGGAVRAGGGLVRVEGTDADGLADAVGRLGGTTAVGVTGPAADGVAWQTGDAATDATVTVDRTDGYTVARPLDGAARYRAGVTTGRDGSPRATLHLTDAQQVTLDGVALPARPPLTVALTSADPVTLVTTGDPTPVDPRRGLVTIGASTTLTAYGAAGGTGLLGAFTDTACATPHAAPPTPAAGCRSAPIRPAPHGTIMIHFGYRTESSATGGVCVWQVGPDRCASVPHLLPGPGWQEYAAVVSPDPGTTAIRLQLPAPGSPAVAYRDIGVRSLRPIGRAVLTATAAPTVTLGLAAGAHAVAVRGPAAPDVAAAGLVGCGRPGPPVLGPVTLAAPAASPGCVRTADVTAASPGRYGVAFGYQAAPGASPRACVWQAGPDRCADLPALPTGPGWHTFSGTVTAEPGTRALSLYLYADGQAGHASTVSYRDIHLTPSVGTDLLLTATTGTATTGTGPLDPRVATRQSAPDRFRARVSDARGTFVLTVAESYAPGWRIDGLPAGWSAVHFEADGYANGWLVTGVGAATLTIGYRPDLWAEVALWISVLTAILILLGLAARRLVTRRRGATEEQPRPPAQRGSAPPTPLPSHPSGTPLVSIVVPTRDSAELMHTFLRSCRASSYPRLEVVVNDDVRSTDRLDLVAAGYAAAGLPVTYLMRNLSMAQGRAVGAEHASGDILMHLDADMELTPDLVAECVALIGEGADALVVPEESFGTTFWAGCKALEKRCYHGVDRIESLRVLTRACYQAVGGHDHRMVFSEDKDLDLRVRAAGYRLGRTRAHLRHDEGHLTLRATLAKKRRYAHTARVFADAHPGHFAWQANVLHRYALYLRRADLLRADPRHYLGLLFLKAAESAAAAAGLITPRLSRRTTPPAADTTSEPATTEPATTEAATAEPTDTDTRSRS